MFNDLKGESLMGMTVMSGNILSGSNDVGMDPLYSSSNWDVPKETQFGPVK